MHRLKDVRSRIRSGLPAMTVAICVLQPLLDVLSYFQIQLEVPNFSFGIRIAAICVMLLAALPFLRWKKLFVVFLVSIILFLAGHVAACLQLNPAYQWYEDLSEHARFLMLPVTTYCFIVFFRANDKVFPALKTGLVIAFSIILTIMLLSVVTGTDPHTYADKELGIRGWFFWTSAQSAILSMLCPLVITWTLERFSWKPLPLAVGCLLCFGALFAFGTRLAFASLIATGICMAAGMLIVNKKHWPQSLTAILCTAFFVVLLPISPMSQNRSALQENLQIKQERIDAAAAKEAQRIGADLSVSDKQPDLRVLAAAYRYNLQGMIDRFGIERVASAYDYTLNAAQIFDSRVRKLNFSKLLMEESKNQSPLALLFGLELSRTRVEETEVYSFMTDDWIIQAESSDPENDLFGIYYLGGIVGFGLLLLFLAFFAWNSIKIFLSERRKTLSPPVFAFLISFAIALVYAWITVSVLRRNNASYYFAAVLACIYDLSRRKLSDLTKGE